VDPARNDGTNALSDAELVRLVVMGNHDAMGVIFDRHYRLMMAVALRIIHDPAEAEDVVQMVFTEFYRKAKLFDETKGTLRTWLLQYAYGRSFNQRRKLRVSCFSEHVELEEAEAEQRKRTSERILNLATPDATRLVEEILPRLSEKQRSVIRMAFFEGLKLSEVASRTGDSVGNIRHAYYRGIDKLRALVSEPAKQPSSEPSAEEAKTSWLPKPRTTPKPLTRKVDIA
jgi:RNA polymerase sigma-70 factor, ECF subfamily